MGGDAPDPSGPASAGAPRALSRYPWQALLAGPETTQVEADSKFGLKREMKAVRAVAAFGRPTSSPNLRRWFCCSGGASDAGGGGLRARGRRGAGPGAGPGGSSSFRSDRATRRASGAVIERPRDRNKTSGVYSSVSGSSLPSPSGFSAVPQDSGRKGRARGPPQPRPPAPCGAGRQRQGESPRPPEGGGTWGLSPSGTLRAVRAGPQALTLPTVRPGEMNRLWECASLLPDAGSGAGPNLDTPGRSGESPRQAAPLVTVRGPGHGSGDGGHRGLPDARSRPGASCQTFLRRGAHGVELPSSCQHPGQPGQLPRPKPASTAHHAPALRGSRGTDAGCAAPQASAVPSGPRAAAASPGSFERCAACGSTCPTSPPGAP